MKIINGKWQTQIIVVHRVDCETDCKSIAIANLWCLQYI